MNIGALFSAETKLLDITDQALKVLGVGKSKLQDILTSTKSDSLTKQVAGAISIFPVIVTNDIPVNAASVIAQMLELEYANYMTLALANSPKVSINEINDAKYLQRFHTNLSKLESVLCESFDPDNEIECAMGRSLIDRTMNDLTITPAISKQLMKSMREGMEVKPRIYGLDWLMEESKPKNTAENGDDDKRRAKADPDKDRDRDQHRSDRRVSQGESSSDDQEGDTKSKLAKVKTGTGIAKDVVGIITGTLGELRAGRKEKADAEEREYKRRREEEQTTDDHVSRNFTQTYNYKSINDMQPTPVTARIFTVDDNGTPSRSIDVVSGVKAKIHPINKAEFLDLAKSDSKGNLLAQIIKMATGEKEFFSTLFGSDTIKKYAINASKFHSNGSKMLAVIRRVKDMNRHGSNYKPNATLVVSKAAADELKRTVGIDLLDEDEALELCNNLSLIKFIVCDSLGGKLHILMPGMYDSFSVMSLDTVEKQVDATMDASLTKELRKVISKGD